MTTVYLNGAFVAAEESLVPADDAGLLFGRGVYETFRARRGHVFRLDQHAARLGTGAGVLGIKMPPAIGRLAGLVRELADRCGLDDARIRLTLTAGPTNGEPSLLIQARAATDYTAEQYERGMTAIVARVRRNDTSPLSRVKSLNCLDNVMSREEAQAAGADTALLLNTRGLVAEASTANVFAFRGEALVTPPLDDGALPGVTRSAVLDLAAATGLTAHEESIALPHLLAAGEVFLTGAVMGVMPLVSLDGQTLGDGQPGAITRRVMGLYEDARLENG